MLARVKPFDAAAGKTTAGKGIHKFCMLASTGRAAAVLRCGKTGFSTKTVHGELYHFSKVDGIDESMFVNNSTTKNGQMSLQFATRVPDQDKILYIVDEASMLSGDFMDTVFFATFGSGVLLNGFFLRSSEKKQSGDFCRRSLSAATGGSRV